MPDKKSYRHYVLFSKNQYDEIPNGYYWDALLHIASAYNGLEVQHQRLIYIYEHTTDAVKYFLPNLSFEKWNGQLLMTARLYEKDSLVQQMIKTNIYFLNSLSADMVGESWDWLEKDNLLEMKFETKTYN